jgi:hypothetical protein
MPQVMRRESTREAEGLPVGLEAGADLRRLEPPAPLSHPQRRVITETEPRADVLGVVGDRVHRPAHHQRDVPAPRRLAPLGLAATDMQHPVLPELRRRRIPAPVRDVELRHLRPAQPPPVDDLEHRRVPVGGQRPLPLRMHGAVHLVIGVVQEPLQLFPGERPRFRVPLVTVKVRDRVPLMTDRHRMRPVTEFPLAGSCPPVAAVAQVLAEQPQVHLVAANRRRGQAPLAHQRLRPLIDVRRPPAPRVLVR